MASMLPGLPQQVALQRYGHVDEIANFFAFLASPEASWREPLVRWRLRSLTLKGTAILPKEMLTQEGT